MGLRNTYEGGGSPSCRLPTRNGSNRSDGSSEQNRCEWNPPSEPTRFEWLCAESTETLMLSDNSRQRQFRGTLRGNNIDGNRLCDGYKS